MVNFPKWHLKSAWSESEPVAGVCLTELGVGVAVVSEHAGQAHLLDAVFVPCVDAMAHGKVLDQAKFSQALIHAISQLSMPVHQAIGCVHDDVAMSTVIELAGCLNDDEIEASILMDAERYIAQSLDGVCFDFVVLAQSPMTTTVRLVVAHKQAVDTCLEILATAGLDVKGISVYADAMRQAVQRFVADAQTDDVAILDIAHQQTQLFVYQHGQFSHRQTYLFGVSELAISTEPAHDALSATSSDLSSTSNMGTDTPSEQGLDFYQFLMQYQDNQPYQDSQINQTKQAYQANQDNQGGQDSQAYQANQALNTHHEVQVDTRHQFTQAQDDYQLVFDDEAVSQSVPCHHAKVIHQDYQPLVGRLASVLQAYQAHQGALPRRVLICGLSADTWAGLDTQLAAALDTHHDIQVAFAAAEIQKLGTQSSDNARLLPAMALSLTQSGADVNLLPWREWRRERVTQQFYRRFMWLMAVLISLIAVVAGYLMYQTHRQETINQAIIQRIDDNQAKIREKQHLEQQLAKSKEQLQALDGAQAWRKVIYRWQQLAQLLPSGVYLDGVQQQGDTVTLTGMALSANQVAGLSASLETSGLYTDVLVVSLQSVDAQNRDKVRGAMSYIITARLLDVDTALLDMTTEQSTTASDLSQASSPSAQINQTNAEQPQDAKEQTQTQNQAQGANGE